MDLSTIKNKIKSGEINSIAKFKEYVTLMWDNCQKYNIEGSEIY